MPMMHPNDYFSSPEALSNLMVLRKLSVGQSRNYVPICSPSYLENTGPTMKLPHVATRSSCSVTLGNLFYLWHLVIVCSCRYSIEIYFKDSRSLLIVFLDKKRRSEVGNRLSAIMGRPYTEPAPMTVQRTPLLGRMGSRMLAGLKNDELSTATRKWQAREISNVCLIHIFCVFDAHNI